MLTTQERDSGVPENHLEQRLSALWNSVASVARNDFNSLRTALLTVFSAETITRYIFVGLQSHPVLVSELFAITLMDGD